MQSFDRVHYIQYSPLGQFPYYEGERGLMVKSEQGYAGPTNIRGVDQHLWRWLKAQAALEGKTIGRKLNEILARYKSEAESQ